MVDRHAEDAAQVMALVGGQLVVGTGASPIRESAVVIQGDRIAAAGPIDDVQIPDGAAVVPADGKTVMPGLINCHTHLCLDGSADPMGAWQQRSMTENVLVAARHAAATLRAGVTTVRDLGGWSGVDLGLRQAIADGLIPGPRMLVAGQILCMTGGHGHDMGLEVDGPDEARKGARRQLKAGADIIKVMATGGVMTPGVEPGSPQLTYEELCAAIEEADKAGKLTATHAQGTEGIKNAVRAGIGSVEHAFYLDAEAIDMMLERGTWLVPTLAACYHVVEAGAEAGIPAYVVEKARRGSEAQIDSFRRAREAGVQIAAGNDGGTPFNEAGNLVSELERMVAAGVPNHEALATAHGGAAALLRLEEEIGSAEPGKRADLVVVDGDPLTEMSALRRVAMVYQAGRRI